MNTVEIEEAISALAAQPFDGESRTSLNSVHGIQVVGKNTK